MFNTILLALGVLGIGNVVFAVMLFQWKKLGFWRFVATSIGALMINLSIGLSVGQAFAGLIGIAVLYGVLQITKDGVGSRGVGKTTLLL